MMPAHEVDAMAAIARADVDGFSMRGQRCGNGRIGGIASCGGRRRRLARHRDGTNGLRQVGKLLRYGLRPANESAFRVASIGCGGDCTLGQN